MGVDIGYWCWCWIFTLTLILDIVIRHRILKLDAKIEIGIHMIHSHWHCLLHIDIGCEYPTSLSIFNSNSNIRHQYLISICHFNTHVQYQYPISIPPYVALFFQWFLKESRNRCSVVVCLSASHDIDFVLDIATDIGCWWWYWILKLILVSVDIGIWYWYRIFILDIYIGLWYWHRTFILDIDINVDIGCWVWILDMDIGYWYWT